MVRQTMTVWVLEAKDGRLMPNWYKLPRIFPDEDSARALAGRYIGREYTAKRMRMTLTELSETESTQ